MYKFIISIFSIKINILLFYMNLFTITLSCILIKKNTLDLNYYDFVSILLIKNYINPGMQGANFGPSLF